MANAYAGDKLSLPDLEQQVLTAPAIRIAEAEREAADARHQIAVVDLSPKLFISGTAASTKDAVRPERYTIEQVQDGTQTSTERILTASQDRYGRYGGVVGIRIPLFGSRDIAMRNIEVADAGLGASRAKEQVARMETIKALRYAYVENFFRRAQARLAQAYLESQADAERVFEQRKNARLLLDADYRALRATFQSVRQAGDMARGLETYSAAKIQQLTGRSIDGVELAPPALATNCTIPAATGEAGNLHPEIDVYTAALEEKRRLLAIDGSWRPESGLTVSHGIQRYEGGSTGSSTAVSFDLQIPLGAWDLQNARKKLAQNEVTKAEIQLDAKRDEFFSALEKTRSELALRRGQIETIAQQLNAKKEAHRVAWLRAGNADGDAVESMANSKFALYQAYHEQIEAELELAKAEIDMMGLTHCESEVERHVDILPDALPLMSRTLFQGKTQEFRKAVYLPGKGDATSMAQNGKLPALGWYAWHTLNRFEPEQAEQFWSDIPATNRVLLSLTSEQIRSVTSIPRERERLSTFIASAKERKVEVSLLLGDPGWALPGEGKKLLKIVRSLSAFPFSGIHLDIEQSQLTPDKQKAWASNMVSLVSSLRAETRLPIAVSLHPRDLKVPGFLRDLKAAGANEASVMHYSTNREKVVANLTEVMRKHPALHFSLAQSIEPSLARDESYAKKSLKTVAAAWDDIMQLGSHPNFSGILVQSLDDYLNGALHED